MPSQQKERRGPSPHILDIRTDSDGREIHAGHKKWAEHRSSTLQQHTGPIRRRTFLKLGGSGLAALASRRVFGAWAGAPLPERSRWLLTP